MTRRGGRVINASTVILDDNSAFLPRRESVIEIRCACACLNALVMASCTIRHALVSTIDRNAGSPGQRPSQKQREIGVSTYSALA